MALLNFRDVASTPGMSPLTAGRLFRSAQPFHLTTVELDQLLGAGVRTIIDLRDERELVPPDWELAAQAGLRLVRVPLAEQVMSVESPASVASIRTAEDGHRFLGSFYVAVTEHARAGLSTVIDVVADREPVLVHCAAGKDRTGTAVAILLDLLGVPDHAIVADYLLTNLAMPEIQAQLTSGVPAAEAIDPSTIPPGLSGAPELAIRILLAHLRSSGGAANLLKTVVSPQTLAGAVRALTAGAGQLRPAPLRPPRRRSATRSAGPSEPIR